MIVANLLCYCLSMKIDYSKIFHQSSKILAKNRVSASEKYEDWPEEWKTTYYKAYPRLPKIDLTEDSPSTEALSRTEAIIKEDAVFFNLIKKRQSRRNFNDQPINKKELSLLLKYSCGNTSPMEHGRYHRAQPSGGARFPIEVYPIVFRSSEDLKTGLYHYNVKDHKLDVLWDRKFNDKEIDELFTYDWVKNAAVAIIMTAVFWRNQNKYGERGYRMILQESGHIGQNIYLVSEALGLKCCALSGTVDDNLEKLIDIDGITESIVYALALGK